MNSKLKLPFCVTSSYFAALPPFTRSIQMRDWGDFSPLCFKGIQWRKPSPLTSPRWMLWSDEASPRLFYSSKYYLSTGELSRLECWVIVLSRQFISQNLLFFFVDVRIEKSSRVTHDGFAKYREEGHDWWQSSLCSSWIRQPLFKGAWPLFDRRE